MPHTIAEIKSVKVGSVLYGSLQSQTTRNSFILANWAGHEGSLSTGCDDVRPQQVMSFSATVLRLNQHSLICQTKDMYFILQGSIGIQCIPNVIHTECL